MTEIQIVERLQTYFASEQGASNLGPEDSLLQSGILDSLAIVKLLSFIEEEFDVEVDDADFDPDNFENLRSIAKLVSAGPNS